MAAIPLTEASVVALKNALSDEFPEVKSSHLSEALAHAAGFRTHAALLASIARSQEGDQLLMLSTQKMLERLLALGYPSRPGFEFEMMSLNDVPGAVSTTPVSALTRATRPSSVHTRADGKTKGMNLEQLKKNVGFRVQLEPPAIHLDALGRELAGNNEDWIIASVTDSGVRLDESVALGLTTTIGKDAVHHFTSNPSRSIPGGIQYGFLSLTVQMFIQQDRITYRPCSRPGERVPPLPAPIAEKLVDFNYPKASGIQDRLEAAGYRVAWVRGSRLASLELQGWEVVAEKDAHGMPTSFHLRDRPENQVFVKKREPDLQTLANSPYWRTRPGFISCSVDVNARALVLRFADPTSAAAFLVRAPTGIRCQLAPGRLDTVLGHLAAPR